MYRPGQVNVFQKPDGQNTNKAVSTRPYTCLCKHCAGCCFLTDVFGCPQVIDAFLEPAELQKFSDEDKLQWHRPNIAAIKVNRYDLTCVSNVVSPCPCIEWYGAS